jgi:DNA modification methylase
MGMRIERKKINELKEFPGNPRIIDLRTFEKLKRSIHEFGYVEPLVWNEATGHVVGGNQRLKALKSLGIDEVEVVVVNLSEAQEKILNLALNRIQGEWDYNLLKEILIDIENLEGDLDLTGFTDEELELFLRDVEELVKKEKKEIKIKKRAKKGDLWRLGEHLVLCGDSTDPNSYERLLKDLKINTIVTSPPYAMQRKEEYGGIPADEYPSWFVSLSAILKNYLADDGSFFVNIKEHFEKGQRSLYVMKMVIKMVEEGQWKFIDELIWKKTGLPGGYKNRLRNEFEPVFWFIKDTAKVVEREVEEGWVDDEEAVLEDEYGRVFYFSKETKIRFYPKSIGKPSDEIVKKNVKGITKTTNRNVSLGGVKQRGIARPGNVINLKTNKEIWGHPAMYPIELPLFLIKLTTLVGDIVFDPFLGAGTTLIAAERLKRKCFGIELKEEYVDIILARWEAETGGKAELIKEAEG